jgi:hypothetical protein
MTQGEKSVVKYGTSVDTFTIEVELGLGKLTGGEKEQSEKGRNITVPKTKGRSENRLSEKREV